jgi:cytochrome c2
MMTDLAMRGRMLLWTVTLVTAAGVARAGDDAARGEKLYEDCAACHSIERGVNGVGPTLYGIFGRKAGELDDYRYSPALKRSGIIWTEGTLDTFIADSQATVPANRMPYAGMLNAADRSDLIAYLQKASK